MATRVWEMGLFLFLVFGTLTWAEPQPEPEPSRVSSSSLSSSSDVCPPVSITDSILGFRDFCAVSSIGSGGDFVGVTEGDDVSLQKVLNLVHKTTHEYVAVLFYASWCPFSRTCRPTFAVLSSLYPAISHFAFEESVVRPSILSRYGVHGFPTLFLINSTMRVRYHGSRTIGSLVAFYNDVTGMKPVSLGRTSLEKMGNPSNLEEFAETEPENCPFSWARSPENLLRQETYLALATIFVLLRLLYFLLPAILAYASSTWRRHIRNASLMSLWEHPLAYLGQAMQVFKALKEPCKRSNLQERAMNARSWASKSLVSVSLGEASSSRGSVGNERR